MIFQRNIVSYLQVHPAILSAVGLAPLVIKSNNAVSGLMISLGFTLVLVFSALTVSLLRNLFSGQLRLPFLLLTSSVWTTVLDMLLQTWFYESRLALDVYIPLLAMNSLLLLVLEKDALTMSVTNLFVQTARISSVVLLLCIFTGLLREWLAHGTLLSGSTWLTSSSGPVTQPIFVLPLFDTAAGAFIVIGCLLAIINYFNAVKQDVSRTANDKGA